MKDRSEESNSSRMHRHRYLYCVYCLTPPTILCSDMYYCVLQQYLIVYCNVLLCTAGISQSMAMSVVTQVL